VCSLGGLLLSVGATGVGALAIMHRIEKGEAALRDRDSGRTLERLRSDIYLSGTLARDYFSDPDDPDAPALLARLRQVQEESGEALNQPELVAKLRGDAIAYWKVLDLMVEMTSTKHGANVEAYFRRQLAQRRETMLRIAREIDQEIEAQ